MTRANVCKTPRDPLVLRLLAEPVRVLAKLTVQNARKTTTITTTLPELRNATYRRRRGRGAFYFIATLTADMPHGHPTFDGMLKKTDGGWSAATWVGPGIWGPVGKTRVDAIRKIIPATVKLMEAYLVEESRKREELLIEEAEASRIQRIKDAGPELLAVLERLAPLLNTAARVLRLCGNTEEAALYANDEAIARAAIAKAKDCPGAEVAKAAAQ